MRLPTLFSDGMVLQQGMAVRIWGWADDGERVTVSTGAQSRETIARGGRWQIRLSPMAATADPFRVVVTGSNRIEIKDVVVGEVWVAAGQSNMEWPLSRSEASSADITAAANPLLRLFNVPRSRMPVPAQAGTGSWIPSSPDSAGEFSAVAWYFGRALQRARNTPVGLIHASFGGSPAEAWVSSEARGNVTAPPGWEPGELFNGMIAALIPYGIRGVIWYQGESNVPRAHRYRVLLTTLIADWRGRWQQGNFPFLLVQLPAWDRGRHRSLEEIAAAIEPSSLAELREAQWQATLDLPGVAMIVTTDAGARDDLHPPGKRVVGERLALAARAVAYGEPVLHAGPGFRSVDFHAGGATVHFDERGAGMQACGTTPPGNGKESVIRGFTLAAADRVFHPAVGRLYETRVEVSSPEVAAPVAVRFGWADFPLTNLCSRAGLPAPPFRSDHWPLSR